KAGDKDNAGACLLNIAYCLVKDPATDGKGAREAMLKMAELTKPKSLSIGKAKKIQIVNKTQSPLKVYWCSSTGEEKFINDVKVNATNPFNSFALHFLRVRDADEKPLRLILTTAENETVTIE